MTPPPEPMINSIVPLRYIISTQQTTTSTTSSGSTTESNIAVAIPYPVPMPVQIAVPAMPPQFCIKRPKHKKCPPCPPCLCAPTCTPSFFSYCSSCHQKCRCRKREDVPKPLPPLPPRPLPGPAFAVPFPVAVPIPLKSDLSDNKIIKNSEIKNASKDIEPRAQNGQNGVCCTPYGDEEDYGKKEKEEDKKRKKERNHDEFIKRFDIKK
ncbi:deubiquitinase and deneddylase Dub1-like [Achroia grisella]|uniref:deubiquitinase and deneddylase Dub1-like n=1 Tax=Achroia grisella TaxID=688607 RepID=UPI0027D20626|nr:deubiquitinase and deneddylase Dub1-like [Achroia grisella]